MTSEFDCRFAIYLKVFYFITKIYCFAFECEAFLCIVSLFLNLILHKLQYPFCMQSLLKEKIPKEYVYCFFSDIANSNYYICSQEIKHFLQYSRPPEMFYKIHIYPDTLGLNFTLGFQQLTFKFYRKSIVL